MTSRILLETNPHAQRSPAGHATWGPHSEQPDSDPAVIRATWLRSTTAAVALAAILTGCTSGAWDTSVDVSPLATRTTGKTQLPADSGSAEVDRRPQPKATVEKGSGQLVGQGGAGGAQFAAEENGDITLNFVNANVRDVADAVLGQMLHLNYTVDPKAQATITMQTSKPITRDAVLPLLENALAANGIALVRSDDLYRLVPLANAARSGSMPTSVRAPAPRAARYSLQGIPLKNASALPLQKRL